MFIREIVVLLPFLGSAGAAVAADCSADKAAFHSDEASIDKAKAYIDCLETGAAPADTIIGTRASFYIPPPLDSGGNNPIAPLYDRVEDQLRSIRNQYGLSISDWAAAVNATLPSDTFVAHWNDGGASATSSRQLLTLDGTGKWVLSPYALTKLGWSPDLAVPKLGTTLPPNTLTTTINTGE